jgi:hypothetical protein
MVRTDRKMTLVMVDAAGVMARRPGGVGTGGVGTGDPEAGGRADR